MKLKVFILFLTFFANSIYGILFYEVYSDSPIFELKPGIWTTSIDGSRKIPLSLKSLINPKIDLKLHGNDIVIETKSNTQLHASITNLSGQMIKRITLQSKGLHRINRMKSGIYFITISENHSTICKQKLIIY